MLEKWPVCAGRSFGRERSREQAASCSSGPEAPDLDPWRSGICLEDLHGSGSCCSFFSIKVVGLQPRPVLCCFRCCGHPEDVPRSSVGHPAEIGGTSFLQLLRVAAIGIRRVVFLQTGSSSSRSSPASDHTERQEIQQVLPLLLHKISIQKEENDPAKRNTPKKFSRAYATFGLASTAARIGSRKDPLRPLYAADPRTPDRQYSSGKRKVVTLRSHSVMIQILTPAHV